MVVERDDLALGGRLIRSREVRSIGSIVQSRQPQDVFRRWRARGGAPTHVIYEHAGVQAALIAAAAVLHGRALGQDEERLAVGGKRDPFEALIVAPSIGGRVDGVIARDTGRARLQSIRNGKDRVDFLVRVEVINVGPVFVADVTRAVAFQHERLGVERQLVHRHWMASVRSDGRCVARHERHTAADRDGAHPRSAGGRIQSRRDRRAATGCVVGELHATGVVGDDLILGGHFFSDGRAAYVRRARVGRENKVELLDAGRVVGEDRARVEAAVGERVEDAAIAGPLLAQSVMARLDTDPRVSPNASRELAETRPTPWRP